MEIYWGNAWQIYVTPVCQEEICVTLISHQPDKSLALSTLI